MNKPRRHFRSEFNLVKELDLIEPEQQVFCLSRIWKNASFGLVLPVRRFRHEQAASPFPIGIQSGQGTGLDRTRTAGVLPQSNLEKRFVRVSITCTEVSS